MRLVVSALALLAPALLAGPAGASTCLGGCRSFGQACRGLVSARVRSCKADCRVLADASRARCARGCRQGASDAERACRAEDRVTCRLACRSADACVERCGVQLAGCSDGIRHWQPRCRRRCGRQADPDACLRSCVATWNATLEGCRAGFATCRTTCGSSPSGSFLD